TSTRNKSTTHGSPDPSESSIITQPRQGDTPASDSRANTTQTSASLDRDPATNRGAQSLNDMQNTLETLFNTLHSLEVVDAAMAAKFVAAFERPRYLRACMQVQVDSRVTAQDLQANADVEVQMAYSRIEALEMRLQDATSATANLQNHSNALQDE
ncbi:hypothetical protein LTS18_007492, partial [Coniosporium uncinatum]